MSHTGGSLTPRLLGVVGDPTPFADRRPYVIEDVIVAVIVIVNVETDGRSIDPSDHLISRTPWARLST